MAVAKKPAILKKPKKDDKSYTKTQMIAHLTEAVNKHGLGDITKKHTVAFLEELNELLFLYAPVGSKLPGLGKLLVKEVPARPARTVNIGGVERQVPRKPKSKKLVFRLEKSAKDRFLK